MDYEVDICHLSQAFFTAYPAITHPEIMYKEDRPYTCLLIETSEDYFICIPFRSSIKHNEAFIFSNTHRSRKSRSGLDYKKTVIIKDSSYIETGKTVVDNDEYNAMINNIEKIVKDIHSYINKYVNHVNGTNVMHEREFERHYKYSTLPYFHDILGCNNE